MYVITMGRAKISNRNSVGETGLYECKFDCLCAWMCRLFDWLKNDSGDDR